MVSGRGCVIFSCDGVGIRISHNVKARHCDYDYDVLVLSSLALFLFDLIYRHESLPDSLDHLREPVKV